MILHHLILAAKIFIVASLVVNIAVHIYLDMSGYKWPEDERNKRHAENSNENDS